MNRLDEIVVFDPLSRDELRKFARLHMKDVVILLAERGVALGVTDAALDLVLQEAYDPVSNHFFFFISYSKSILPGDVPVMVCYETVVNFITVPHNMFDCVYK